MRKILYQTILLVLISISSNAQDLFKGKDLSQFKVDMITETELSNLKAQISSSGLTLDQAEQLAISKGMPSSEAAKLKQKLSSGSNNRIDSKNSLVNNVSSNRENSDPDLLNSSNRKDAPTKTLINPLIFGSELYSSTSMSFEPNLKLATPINYVLGPEDQIQVTVYGVQEYNGSLNISPEGSVSIPNVGEVKLAGMTIEAATQKLKNIMGNSVYSYLKTGGAKLSVSLSKIRSISVTIIGSNRPGNFKVSSLASVYNALFIAGGPSNFGSFREIELIRNNKLEKKIDLYRFLLEGNQADNIGLKDNDVIRIPAYKTRVELRGEVKRPGIFELLPGESFSKILAFASGFTDDAYMESVKILKRNDKERQIQDVNSNQYFSYQPQSGDVIEVSKILERFKNKVVITGAVFRPDKYELSENLKVGELIKKADGLKLDAFIERGQIIRINDDLSKSILSFDISKAISGDILNNILLKREDSVIINSISDLSETYNVIIQGEVRKPGKYGFINKLSLKDLIIQAGGFTDAAFKNIEVARILKKDSLLATDSKLTEIYKTQIVKNELGLTESNNIQLSPFDVVTVRKIAGYKIPESITIDGQVQYPGQYSIENGNERISDYVKRAGGFSSDAYPEGAYIKRFKSLIDKEKLEDAVVKLQKSIKGSKLDSMDNINLEMQKEYDKIPLDMLKIMKTPGSLDDLVLLKNDQLVIPKFVGEVRINGEVLVSTQVPFQNKASLKKYIDLAGGFTPNALKRKTYVIYANGKAASTSSFLFIKNYPKLEPGCELIVPRKREKKVATTAELVGFTSAIASLLTVFVLLKN